MELKKNKTNKATLDVTCENRHDVLRQKKLLIGCGGGLQQECSQSYSPVARWIAEVALTLTDESQQYGNREETSLPAHRALVLTFGRVITDKPREGLKIRLNVDYSDKSFSKGH